MIPQIFEVNFKIYFLEESCSERNAANIVQCKLVSFKKNPVIALMYHYSRYSLLYKSDSIDSTYELMKSDPTDYTVGFENGFCKFCKEETELNVFGYKNDFKICTDCLSSAVLDLLVKRVTAFINNKFIGIECNYLTRLYQPVAT